MDDKEFKDSLAKMSESSEVLNKLPAEVRVAAFNLLFGGVVPHRQQPLDGAKNPPAGSPIDVTDAESFFSQFSHDQPADNAKLIAGYIYSQFGSEPFTVEEIRQLAKQIGLTIPDRVDATLNSAQSEGKKLFQGAGKGKYKPTTHGETYLKATYNIKKGTKQRPNEGAD